MCNDCFVAHFCFFSLTLLPNVINFCHNINVTIETFSIYEGCCFMCASINNSIKRLVVFSELEREIVRIFNEEHEEYLMYAAECEVGESSPEKFLKEIIEIGKNQNEITSILSKIQKYYGCDETYAILLYRFTSANFLNYI